jgi:hypothetical protein
VLLHICAKEEILSATLLDLRKQKADQMNADAISVVKTTATFRTHFREGFLHIFTAHHDANNSEIFLSHNPL